MWWRRRRNREQDLEHELRSDLELEAAEQEENGRSPEEARCAARRALGNASLIKEDTRAAWGGITLEALWQDIRFSLRMMQKTPGVALIAVITLALGIGANTAIFGVVNTVLVRPLPYKDANRLMTVWGYNRPRGFDTEQVSVPDFEDWKSQNHVFEDMAASTDVMYTLTGSGEPTPIIGYSFSANFFHVLGVQPLLGRAFLPDEQQAGKDHVVVLSYRLWQTHFGGDPSIIGKSIRLDAAPYTVIGIMPPRVEYPGATELWTPLTISQEAMRQRDLRFLRVIARLGPGVTLDEARREMNAIANRLAQEYPKTNKEINAASIISLTKMIRGDIRAPLLVLMCAVGFVLLIACANVANLLLVRAAVRRKEIAVRTALGARRGRLVRQFLTESVLLSTIGSALGLLLALFATKGMTAMFPPSIANLNIPRVERIPIDGWVLAFAVLSALLTGLIFGSIPALEAAGIDPNEPLKESSRTVAGTVSGQRFRGLLVAAEVALSLILLAGAGLMLRSFAHLVKGELGFNPQDLLTLRILLPQSKYASEMKQAAFGREALTRIQALPGVGSAATVTFLPLSGWWGTRPVSLTGGTSGHEQRVAVWSSITPDYFRAMRIPLLAGRSFNEHDNSGSTPVAIISSALARQLAPDKDPIGMRLSAGFKSPVEVVGVVGDVHQLGMTSELTSAIYVPFAQFPMQLICFVIRTTGNPMALANAAKRQIWQIDKDQAVAFVMPMAQLASESLAPQRVVSILLGTFAGMALLMAMVGIYGVISFAVVQRTHEIGVRMALGAASGDVLKLVTAQGLAPVAAGLIIGLFASFGLTRFLSSLLYGVHPSDPLTFFIVSALLLVSALAAIFLPVRRALSVDPLLSLRHE